MTAEQVLKRLHEQVKALRRKSFSDGRQLTGSLRASEQALLDFRQCTREDWEEGNWRVSDADIQAIQTGTPLDIGLTLKRILWNTGVPVSGKVDIVSGGDLFELPVPLERELRTFLRELPGLLRDGHAGKHALIHGDQLVSIWDTFEEAHEEGCRRYELGVPFMAQPIDERFLAYAQELAPASPAA